MAVDAGTGIPASASPMRTVDLNLDGIITCVKLGSYIIDDRGVAIGTEPYFMTVDLEGPALIYSLEKQGIFRIREILGREVDLLLIRSLSSGYETTLVVGSGLSVEGKLDAPVVRQVNGLGERLDHRSGIRNEGELPTVVKKAGFTRGCRQD